MEEIKWKKELMDKFCVTFERAQDDSVVERLEDFIQSRINLAVSKEQSRILEEIEKLSSYWRHPMALFPKERTTQEELKEMKVKEDIINLINTK